MENIHFGPLLLVVVRFAEIGDTGMVIGVADEEVLRDEGPRFVKGRTVPAKVLKKGTRIRYYISLK